MGRRLRDNITSHYFEAANRLASKRARRKVIAYVESYDDVFFWRTILSRFETQDRYFEVMLPTRMSHLERGKKAAISSLLNGVGQDMIACVDADYDYLMQGASPNSRMLLENPYVFHTFAYSIENLQCYASTLHDVAVAVTLNDHQIFDFNDFMRQYSEAIYPLYVWNIWYYRSTHYGEFTITDFNHIIDVGDINIDYPEIALERLRKKVGRAVEKLRQRNPDARESYQQVKEDMKRLGVNAHNTYLYIQGHHLFDHVTLPLLERVCNRLMREREREINRLSLHNVQYQTEISSYRNSVGDAQKMLKKNMGYLLSPQYEQILDALKAAWESKEAVSSASQQEQNKTLNNENHQNREATFRARK